MTEVTIDAESKASLYVIVHEHEYGQTIYPFRSNERTEDLIVNIEDVAKSLGCDNFDYQREEFLTLLPMDEKLTHRLVTL